MIPKVSILMTTHNRAHFLKKAIESVLAQTFGDWELVLINDGSTDATHEIALSYAAKEARIRYFRLARSGLGKARDIALRQAVGTHVTCLDDDDIFYPEKLQVQVEYLEKEPEAAFVYSSVDRIYENGSPSREWPVRPARSLVELIRQCTIQPNAMLARREALMDAGGFDPDMSGCNDYDLWLRVALKHRIDFLPVKVGTYYWHASNMSYQRRKRCWNSLKIYKKLKRLSSDRAVQEGIKRSVIQTVYLPAEEALRKKEYWDAVYYYGLSVLFDFRIGLTLSWSRVDHRLYRVLRPYLAVAYCFFAGIFASVAPRRSMT